MILRIGGDEHFHVVHPVQHFLQSLVKHGPFVEFIGYSLFPQVHLVEDFLPLFIEKYQPVVEDGHVFLIDM